VAVESHERGSLEPAPTAVAAEDKPGAVHSVLKPADRPAPTPAQTAEVYTPVPAERIALASPARPAPVEVNLAELNARIGGYHDGLREIEAAVVAERQQMTAARVGELVSRLEELAAQYEFAKLYYELLSKEERQFVMAPRSLADTLRLVEQQRSRVEAAEGDHFSSTDESEETELARRLQAVAEIAGHD
jgi:hypothetical protein